MGTLNRFLKRSLSRAWYLHLCRRTLPAQIIVKITGGLGNQIWTWALGQAIEARSSTAVVYDTSWFDGNSMDLHGRERRNFDLLKAFPGLNFPTCSDEDSMILRRCTFDPHNKYVYYDSDLSNPAPRWLVGNHWNFGYLRAVPAEAWARLAFTQEIPEQNKDFAGRIDSEPAAAALHIRRGDYVGTRFDVLKPDYYFRAIDELKARLAPVEPVFFVFSNESGWARNMLASRPERFVYADNGNDDAVVDMALMARCQHFIIANSTFSFFAAFLSRRAPDIRIVVAPVTSRRDELIDGLAESEFPRLIKISTGNYHFLRSQRENQTSVTWGDPAMDFILTDGLIDTMNDAAWHHDKKMFYDTLHAPETRRALRTSFRYLTRRPELVLKAMALMAVPNLYFRLRSRPCK